MRVSSGTPALRLIRAIELKLRKSRRLNRSIYIQFPPAKASSQHIELAAVSQRGGLRGVRRASITGNNPRSQGIPGRAMYGRRPRCKGKESDLFAKRYGCSHV